MRSRTFGLYVGAMVDPTFDWLGWLTKIKASGYDTISLFMTTLFYNRELWPWPLKSGKFNFAAIDPEYRENFRKACVASAATGVRLHLCFVDQFHGTKDAGVNDAKHDPFREVFGDWDEEPLYSSYVNGKYWWLKWDPNHDPKEYDIPTKTLSQYKTVGPFGLGMDLFTSMVMSVCATVKRNHPEFPEPTWKWGNETFVRVDESGKKVASRGDRDEVVIWMKAKWKRAGFGNNLYFDYLAFRGGMGREDVAYDIMHDAFTKGIRGKHKAKLEAHGILTVQDCMRFMLDEHYVKFSTDGDAHMRANYKDLGHSPLPDVDLKYDLPVAHPELKTVDDFLQFRFKLYKDYVS